MNEILIFLLSLSGHAATSFYSFQRFGAYSITDFNLDLGMNRYAFLIGMEKRQQDFGIKSLTLEIDSLVQGHKLIVGEKPCYLNGPLSTTLNLWGITLKGRNSDLFIGRTKDPSSLLSPTFEENNYTIGGKFRKNIIDIVPAEFYLLRKSDRCNQNNISGNNIWGTNARIILSDRLSINPQFGMSLSDLGLGSAFALNTSYTTPRYGGNTYFRKISTNYTSASNLPVQSDTWFRTQLYQKPLPWIGFGQDIAYSSIYRIGLGLNTVIERPPFPQFNYGVNFSTNGIGQGIDIKYQYKKFFAATGYTWSKDQQTFGLRFGQTIYRYQIWTGLQIQNTQIYQLAGTFPFSPRVKIKNFLNIARQNGQTIRSLGVEMALRLIQNLNLHTSYEHIYNGVGNEHYLSINLSNNIIFDEIGFGFISGKVFMDMNKNGFFDIEDEPVSGVEVILDGSQNVQTDAHGGYSFSFVKHGQHRISLDLGCMPAEIGPEKRSCLINTDFMKRSRCDFTLDRLGTIEGIIYYDENGNNIKDLEEPGVPNVVVRINGSLTTTDYEGRYRLANLAPGTYIVSVQLLPSGTMLTTPQSTFISLKSGEKIFNIPMAVIKHERPVNKKVFGE